MTTPHLTEIDHVAIAVRDLDSAVAWYQEMFGATVAHREVVARDGVEEALLKVADSYVQLLTPVRDDSTVAPKTSAYQAMAASRSLTAMATWSISVSRSFTPRASGTA